MQSRRLKNSLFYGYVLASRRVRRMPVVHVVGDSHVKAFRDSNPFITHHIHGATAHNLKMACSRSRSSDQLRRVMNRIGRGDLLLMVFGEIDCRIHLYYQFRKDAGRRSMQELIERTVSNYGEVLAQLRGFGWNPCVYSVPPATDVGNQYSYPFYGTVDVRSRITRWFNRQLEQFCKDRGFVFINVYPMVAGRDGLMLEEYADDEIHLNRKVVRLVRREMERELGVRL